MTKGRLGRISDHTGHNVSKRRAGLETRTAEADPPLKRGRLPAERPVQQVASDGEWLIRPKRVRQFIIDHAALVDIRKCDK